MSGRLSFASRERWEHDNCRNQAIAQACAVCSPILLWKSASPALNECYGDVSPAINVIVLKNGASKQGWI